MLAKGFDEKKKKNGGVRSVAFIVESVRRFSKRVNGYRNLQGYLKNKKKKIYNIKIKKKRKGYKMYIVYKMKRRECSEHKCNYSCEFQKCICKGIYIYIYTVLLKLTNCITINPLRSEIQLTELILTTLLRVEC